MATIDTGDEEIVERLAGLPDDASRIEFLSSNPGLISCAFVERLGEAVVTFARIDLKKAGSLADAAVAIANMLGDKESQARAFRTKATALLTQGQNRQASELHLRAIQLFEDAGKPVETGRTLSISIHPLILLGEYDRALAAAERARKILSAADDTVRLARLDINVGNIYHRQDRFEEALECYERAYAQLLPDKDLEGIICALHNAGVCRIMLNDFEKAASAYDQVRNLCRERKLPLAMAQAEYNMAYLHYLRGAYGRAIEGLRAAHQTAEEAGDRYHAALCHLDLSEIYLELNIDQEALELAKQAVNNFRELGMGYETGKALCNAAIALSQQGESFNALELFAQARDLFVQERNLAWPSLIDLYRAIVYFNEGRLPEAHQYCLAAQEFFRNSPLPGRAILCRLLLARLALKTGEIDAARGNCQAALQDLAGREMPLLHYQTQFVMGQTEEAVGNLQEAQKHYRAAKDVLEELRGAVHGEELKISFLKNKLEVYENLVDLCLTAGTPPAAHEEAWSYIEQAKSRSLLELIARRMTPAAPAETDEKSGIARRILGLREQLDWYYHRIEVEQMGPIAASNQRLLNLRELAQERETELLRALRELPPDDVQAHGLAPASPSSLNSVREALGPDTTLLEYFRVHDRILAAVVTREGVEIIALTQATRVAQILRMLQFQFSKFRLGADYLREFADQLLETTRFHLKELYTELLGPLGQRLKGQRLVVVPHELLHYVPFHALFDGERYMIDLCTVSYAPSASIYIQGRQKKVNKTGPSLILGIPDQNTPAMYEELQAVAEIVPQAKLYLGPNANEKILKDAGPLSRLIHIAAHGFFRRDNPMFSGLRLGDSFLTLYDLYHLKLPADLIALSGCSTGLNVIAAGDELIGLVRGLLSAGARTLLLTLWDVNDSSTAEFMKSFYSGFCAGSEAALAVRKTMIEVKQHNPHPYYWAPFILVG